MNQTLYASPRKLREALYVLSIEQDVPDARLLDDVVRRYPEFGHELTEFAIAIAVDALSGERLVEHAESVIDLNTVSPAVSRAMSYFQNRLHAVTAGKAEATSASVRFGDAPNPFSRMTRRQFRDFASRINASTVFVTKLRDRQIEPSTMPPGFQERVADELNVPREVVVAHFAGRQAAPAGQLYKAEGKPVTGARQSFEEAVKKSGMSEAQQERWLEH